MGDLKTKIIRIYSIFFRFVFRYLIFFLALVIAFFVFRFVLSVATRTSLFTGNDPFLSQKSKIIAEFTTFLKQTIQKDDITIHILQWDFTDNKWFITSVNNLITYQGFVLPKYFYLYETIPIKPLTYFSGSSYAVDELEHFITSVIFTKKLSPTPVIRAQLPLGRSLVDDFNLTCMFENKFSSFTCNYYLKKFLAEFFVYKLDMDYSGLERILSALPTASYQQQFCDGLSKYLLYANDHSDTLARLFTTCWSGYEDLFRRVNFFSQIQESLDNTSFTSVSYKDPLLNTYKLLSYQQQLYQDFLINKPDSYKIATYLDFVEDLLQKNILEPFYIDEIYRYHNKYLILSLEKIGYQSLPLQQTMSTSKVTTLLSRLHTLNEGEPMLWLSWLEHMIMNPSLVANSSLVYSGSSPSLSLYDKIHTKLKNIPYLTIDQQSISQNIIDLTAYIKFYSPEEHTTIKSHILLEYTNDMLLVRSISLQNRPEINEVLKNLLLIQDFSLGELYTYIAKNLVFYQQEDTPLSTIDICPELKNIDNISLVSCSRTAIVLDKDTVRYTFSIKDGGIANITLSDTALENSIKASYTSIIQNQYTLLDTLMALVQYQMPTSQHEWTNNAILVFETLQQYLGIKANDIADKDGNILVDISLGDINFIVKYDLTTNILWPWYFKDILVKGKPYAIQNFSLSLTSASQHTINAFVLDPLSVLQRADMTAWQNYLAFVNTKK